MAFDSSSDYFEGTIIDFSDSGKRARAYAVVEVVRRLSFVVPVEKLEAVSIPGEGERLAGATRPGAGPILN